MKGKKLFYHLQIYERAKRHRMPMDLSEYKQTLLNTIGMPLFVNMQKFLLQWDPFVRRGCVHCGGWTFPGDNGYIGA